MSSTPCGGARFRGVVRSRTLAGFVSRVASYLVLLRNCACTYWYGQTCECLAQCRDDQQAACDCTAEVAAHVPRSLNQHGDRGPTDVGLLIGGP
jgi:hypothetical protein